MDIRKYELFILTADTENISKTAALSGYTQSGVSHMLKAFEKEVGVTLFKRDRYGVHLTPVAKELLPYVRRLVKENEKVDQFIGELQGYEKGTISLALPLDYPKEKFLQQLKNFHDLHPNITIHCKEGSHEKIQEWVRTCQIDLGLHLLPVDSSLQTISLDNWPLKISIKNRQDASPMVMKLILFLENLCM